MPTYGITLIIFAGRSVSSQIERTMALAERAIARDTIDRALAAGTVERIIVATDSAEFAESLRGLPVLVEIDQGEFHFGLRLREIVHRHGVDGVLYMGAGSAPLLSAAQIAGLCHTLSKSESAVIANNFYSSDFVAFAPAGAIDRIEPPGVDNNLAFLLHHRAGLRNITLAKRASTQMDVDTPTDLQVLRLHPGAGPHTRAFLEDADIGAGQLDRLMQVAVDPAKEVLIAGRVGAQAWALLEGAFACRTRVVSEERGMRASGRDARGEVRSILGYSLSAVGAKGFFDTLGEMADGAIVDSRIVFEHFRLKPSASDRFHSDLLWPEGISDPFVRDFTQAASAAPIPVVLGGHSLVSGDLWALAEIAALVKGAGQPCRSNPLMAINRQPGRGPVPQYEGARHKTEATHHPSGRRQRGHIRRPR